MFLWYGSPRPRTLLCYLFSLRLSPKTEAEPRKPCDIKPFLPESLPSSPSPSPVAQTSKTKTGRTNRKPEPAAAATETVWAAVELPQAAAAREWGVPRMIGATLTELAEEQQVPAVVEP